MCVAYGMCARCTVYAGEYVIFTTFTLGHGSSARARSFDRVHTGVRSRARARTRTGSRRVMNAN